MIASSTPKPPPKPRRLYQDQLSFLDDLLKKKEDISIPEKLDIITENQKAFFKFMADVMRGGFIGKYVSNDINQGLGHVPNRKGKSNLLDGRDRASSVSVGREGGSNVSVGRDEDSNVSVGRDRVSSVSEERDRASSVSVGRDGDSNVSVGRDRASSVSEERDRASSVSVGRDRASSVSVDRDWETSNFVTEQGTSTFRETTSERVMNVIQITPSKFGGYFAGKWRESTRNLGGYFKCYGTRKCFGRG